MTDFPTVHIPELTPDQIAGLTATKPIVPAPPVSNTPTCAVCSFFNVADVVCARFPPIPLLTQGGSVENIQWTTVWPTVKPSWVCGEFKPQRP